MSSNAQDEPHLTPQADREIEKVLNSIDFVFQMTPVDFLGDHGVAGAQAAVQNQNSLRLELLRLAQTLLVDGGWLGSGHQGYRSVASYFEASGSLQTALSVKQLSATDAQIHGPCPLLSNDRIADLRKNIEDIKLVGASQNEAAGYIIAKLLTLYAPVVGRTSPELHDLSAIVSLGMSNIAVRRMVKTLDVEQTPLKRETLENLREDTSRLLQDTVQIKSIYNKISDQIVNLSAEPKLINKQIDIYRDQATNAINALKEQIGMNETKSLWSKQAKAGSVSYYISLAILLMILIGTPIGVWLNKTTILAYVNDIEQAFISAGQVSPGLATVTAASRLILITAPLALFVWAIRLIVRFNARSMLLMDDAAQRVTMLNTYLFLVDKGAATVQDRGALLEAMFRRAPGHGPETIEPPNLTDVMRYGEVMRDGSKQ